MEPSRWSATLVLFDGCWIFSFLNSKGFFLPACSVVFRVIALCLEPDDANPRETFSRPYILLQRRTSHAGIFVPEFGKG